MTTISKNQALQRWDMLPQVLRDAIYSESTSDFVWKTAEAEHVPEDKIYTVLRITGYILMGFLHPEDMADELKNQLGLDPKICAAIAGAISQRIFVPIRADLDKIYEPSSKFGVGPKMMQDLQAPEIISQTAREAPRVGAVPVAGNEAKAAPAPIAPKKLPDVGWSRSTPETPVVQLHETRPAPPQAAAGSGAKTPTPGTQPPATGPMPAGPKPMMPAGPMGEFERMNFMQQKGKAPEVPTAPSMGTPPKPAEPAPVMLHEDASFKAEPKAPDFRIQLPGVKLNAEKPTTPSRPAMMELNKNATPATPSSSATTPAKVVHYTEYKPTSTGTSRPTMPVPPVSLAPSGPRQITELTSGGDAPPKPSVPMSAPMPPAPQMPKPPATPSASSATVEPAQKVVFKNYTEATLPPKSPYTGAPQAPGSSPPPMPPMPKPPVPPPPAPPKL